MLEAASSGVKIPQNWAGETAILGFMVSYLTSQISPAIVKANLKPAFSPLHIVGQELGSN